TSGLGQLAAAAGPPVRKLALPAPGEVRHPPRAHRVAGRAVRYPPGPFRPQERPDSPTGRQRPSPTAATRWPARTGAREPKPCSHRNAPAAQSLYWRAGLTTWSGRHRNEHHDAVALHREDRPRQRLLLPWRQDVVGGAACRVDYPEPAPAGDDRDVEVQVVALHVHDRVEVRAGLLGRGDRECAYG